MANTGNKIVLLLKQVDSNHGDTPTGLTEANTVDVAGSDYIPPYQNLTECPLSSPTTDCPIPVYVTNTSSTTVFNFEFSLNSTTFTNSNIAKITATITASGHPTYSVDFTMPMTNNYFSGSFTGLSNASLYTLVLTYYDASNTLLQTC